MDTRLHVFDRVLMIITTVIAFALLGIFATMLMASAGIYGLIRHFTNWRRQRASEQAQGVGNIVPRHAHRVIEFYIPDNYKNKVWHRGRIYGTSEVSPRSKQLG
jgi:hypothetical protein